MTDFSTHREPRKPFVPTVQFALEREAAGCSRESLMLVLPASAIPREWRAERSRLLETVAEEAAASEKRAAARAALSALNSQERRP